MIKKKENVIQSQILSFLKIRKIAHNRVNNGQFYVSEDTTDKYGNRRRRRRVVRCNSMNGISDIVVYGFIELENGSKVHSPIYLEVKSQTGRQSQHQKDFEKLVVGGGGFYFIVKSIEDVVRAFRTVEETVRDSTGGKYVIQKTPPRRNL